MTSASAPSSVNLAPTKIRQVRRPAKHVWLECTKIRLSRMDANLIVTPDHTFLTKLRVSFVRKVSGKIKMDSQIVNLIAMLDHTLHLTKVHVSFVRKVNGKIKMDSQIALAVELVNTMIKRTAQQRLIAKIVEPVNTMTERNAQQRLIVIIVLK